VSERLASRGLEGSISIAFEEPARAGINVIVRSHPLPSTLAEALLEGALAPNSSSVKSLGRTGAWSTSSVKTITIVVLLRLRYKLTVHGRRERLLLVEEAGALAFNGEAESPSATGESARILLEAEASADLAEIARNRLIAQARQRIEGTLSISIASHAAERAQSLSEDHARVRAAGVNVPRVSVEAVLPPDVIGLFVLTPGGL
jgi:hypothetical protein